MANWSDLPPEVLQRIFKLQVRNWLNPKPFELKRVFQCISVCKGWRPSAEVVFYTNFNTQNSRKFKKFILCMKRTPRLSRLVRHISVGERLTSKDIQEMSIMFPELESLAAEANRNFFKELAQLPEETRWKKLESFLNPDNTKDISAYVDAVLRYSDSFSNLTLADKILLGPGEEEESYNGDSIIHTVNKFQFKRLKDRLHLFPNLKTLYIADRHSDQSFQQYDDIIEKCSTKLYKLVFEVRPVTATIKSTRSTGVFNIEKIKPRKNIREINVEGPLLYNDQSLIYVMRKFPKLKKIHLNHVEKFYKEAKSMNKIKAAKGNFSIDVVSDFLIFLERIKKYHLGLFKTNLNIAKLMERYIEKKGGDNVILPSMIIRHYVNANSTYIVDIESTNCGNMIRYPNEIKKELVIQILEKPKDSVLPELIKVCGPHISQLVLYMNSYGVDALATNEEYLNTYQLVTGYFLDHIFTYTTRLNCLYVHDARLIQCDDSQVFINTSITHLFLSNTEIYPIVLPQISKRLAVLDTLTLRAGRFKGMTFIGPEEKSPFIELIMPDTNLELLDMAHVLTSIPGSTRLVFDFIYIKAVTKRKSKGRYLKMYPEKPGEKYCLIEKITEEQFNQSMDLPGGAYFYLKFNALKMIQILEWSAKGRISGKIRLESRIV